MVTKAGPGALHEGRFRQHIIIALYHLACSVREYPEGREWVRLVFWVFFVFVRLFRLFACCACS